MRVRRVGALSWILGLLGLLSCASGGAETQVTYDGLHLVPDTKMARVWTRPGASLAEYDKVKLLDCYVAFKKNWQLGRDFSQQISAARMESIKSALAAEFRKVFSEVLEEGGYAIVSQAGYGVLIVRPAIIDLEITSPDPSAAQGRVVARSAGQMTLLVELYDSATGDIIARAVDREAGRQIGGYAEYQSAANNQTQARAILRGWAERLRNALDEARGK